MRYVDSLNWYLVIHGEKITVAWKEIASAGVSGVFFIAINIFVGFFCSEKINVHKR